MAALAVGDLAGDGIQCAHDAKGRVLGVTAFGQRLGMAV